MRRIPLPAAPRAATMAGCLTAASALLAGCSVTVGEGEVPDRLYLGVSTEEVAARMPECTHLQMNAFVTFTGNNNDIGAYNDRVQWTSQNPSIVFVSDGVSASPSGTVYAAGTMVALRPGVATISASYLSLHASITVDVSELSGLHIDSDLTDIAEQLQQSFVLKAVLTEGGPETDITSAASWRFDPAISNAYVESTTGVVQASSSSNGQTVNLVARLPDCDREVATHFRISPIASLTTAYELGSQTELPVGFSDAVRVYAGFADSAAPLQNITAQMSVDAVSDDYIDASLSDDAYYVTARDREGSGSLRLKLDLQPDDQVVDTKSWRVRNTALVDMSLSPEDQRVVYPATGQIDATGRFADGLIMPITRHVSWTSNNEALATVSAATNDAGEVSIVNADGDAQISASITSSNDDVLTDTVNVHAFANQYANETSP